MYEKVNVYACFVLLLQNTIFVFSAAINILSSEIWVILLVVIKTRMRVSAGNDPRSVKCFYK